MDSLEEINKFLERYTLPRLNQEEIENINRSITSTEIESLILKLPTNKNPGPDGFKCEFYHLEKRKHLSFSNYSKKIAEEGTFLTLFYEATITLIP